MQIKALTDQIKLFFQNSGQAWQHVIEEAPDAGKINRDLLFPLLIATAVTQFLGVIFQSGFSATLAALSTAFAHVSATYIGIRLSAFLLSKLNNTFETEIDPDKALQLLAYSMIPYLVAGVLIGLHPSSLYFLKLVYLYIFYLMWQGSDLFFGINDNRRPGFVLISTILLFAIIQAVLTILIKILPVEVVRIA